jgi:hypothetical protein
MRFQEAYAGWQEKRLTQEDAGQLLGVSGRTFRRQIGRFEADGMQGLVDLRMSQVSSRRAPVGEVLGLQRLTPSAWPHEPHPHNDNLLSLTLRLTPYRLSRRKGAVSHRR